MYDLVQPWHMVFASGAARDRLVAAMLERRAPNHLACHFPANNVHMGRDAVDEHVVFLDE